MDSNSASELLSRNTMRCVVAIVMCVSMATTSHLQLNKCLPQRIIVYRDGVGDGMMHTVSQYEVPQMTSCFSDLFGE